MTAPHPPQTPAAAPVPSKKPRGKGLGIASLVLGILAIIFSWIPFINVVGIICGFVGVALGLVGLFVSHRWLSLAGVVLAIVGIILSFTVTSKAANDISRQLNTPPTVQQQNGSGSGGAAGAATDTYAYTATGGSMSVTYGTVSGTGASMNQATASGTWSKTITVKNKGVFFSPSLTVSSTDGSTVSCQITHNGKVVSHQSAQGQFAAASCSG